MQFVGDFQIDGEICDRLVALHRACDRQGLVKRGVVAKDQIISALEEVGRFRYVDARFATVEKAALELIPR